MPEPKQVKEAHIVAYSIEKGQWNETSHEAIPQQAAFINYKDSQGNVHRKHRFNLWDINQDKRPDMVEVLDLEGKIIQRIYDFNFDGQPDKIENASE
ncbi:MAG: hypothetical protein OXT67_07845 [Zetaproteobacteria bacterium]|nr:hypothetical protein [Zetaproteobacteria bacterium]